VSLVLASGCTTHSSGRAFECPSAPYHSRVTSGDLETDPLRGPALGDVSNGVFVHRLTLDDGALTVRPPRAHDRGGYPGGDALCEVMASATVNNFGIGRQSPDTIAAGLARVTVDPSSPSMLEQMYGGPAKRPPAARYQDRLAWVFVVSPQIRSNGGPPTCPPPSKQQRATRHNYVVFVVDARSGGDALLYTEGHYGAMCADDRSGPHVDVPLTSVSVPWRLVSERADRTQARIAIDVTSCESYAPVILADHDTDPARIRVVVSRPFGPPSGSPCGPTKALVLTARPYALHTTLSATLAHDPVGPYVDG